MRGAAFAAAAVLGVGLYLAIAATLEFDAIVVALGSMTIIAVAAVSFVLTEERETRRDANAPAWDS